MTRCGNFGRLIRAAVINAVLCAAWLVMVAVFLIAMPKYYDDLWFILEFRDWLAAQGVIDPTEGGNLLTSGMPWEALAYTVREHWLYDNGRLCNMVVIPLLLLPKWVGSAIVVLFCAVMVGYGFRLAGIDWKRSALVVPALFLWTFFIPWSQHCGAMVYQYNYLVSGGLLLWTLALACTGRDSRWRSIGVFLLAVVVGVWQEGFSVPAFAGVAVCMCIFPACRTRRALCLMAGLAVGIAAVASSPAFRARVNYDIMSGPLAVTTAKALAGHLSFVLLVLLSGVSLCLRSTRRVVLSPQLLFALVAGFAAIIIQIVTVGTRRAGWCADIVSVVGLLYMLRHMPWNGLWYRRQVALSFCLVAGVLTFWHWAVVDVLSVRIGRQMHEFIMRNVSGGEQTIFTDIDTFYDLPAIAAGVPDCGIFTSVSVMDSYHGYFNADGRTPRLVVIPRALRGVTADSGEAVAGGSGWRRQGGYLFAAGEVADGTRLRADVRMWWGTARGVEFQCHPFVSETDGKSYYYIYPWHSRWELMSGEIQGVGGVAPM